MSWASEKAWSVIADHAHNVSWWWYRYLSYSNGLWLLFKHRPEPGENWGALVLHKERAPAVQEQEVLNLKNILAMEVSVGSFITTSHILKEFIADAKKSLEDSTLTDRKRAEIELNLKALNHAYSVVMLYAMDMEILPKSEVLAEDNQLDLFNSEEYASQ